MRRTPMARLLSTSTIAFFFLYVAVSHAVSSPPEEYWHRVLPNTPIPNAITEILNTDTKRGGVGGVVGELASGLYESYSGNAAGLGQSLSTFINYMGQLDDTSSYDPSIAVFFQEKDLKPGAGKMKLAFSRSSYRVSFLPRPDAESIPFSSSRLREILSHFSVDPKSALGKSMTKTLNACEMPAVAGERKICATSLESMVDFSTSSLGTNQLEAVSTVVSAEEKKPQLFAIAPNGIRRLPGDKLVSCHAEAYPYAVFFCHASPARGYVVELVGADGTKVEAVATCHTDTKAWNPKHLAFKVLKVKPGTVPVCHFLPQDHLVWSRNN